jgi:transcriptional regulator of arginine metabolism
MRNKNERLLTIRRIIANEKISGQDELLNHLEKQGFKMTQATLSRDLKYLRVSRIPDEDKGYIYSLPEGEKMVSPRYIENFPMNGFLALEFAQGMCLMKTLPGFASGIGSAIDLMKVWHIAGTIAGDDTILIIPRDGVKKDDLIRQLAEFIPGIKQKYLKK